MNEGRSTDTQAQARRYAAIRYRLLLAHLALSWLFFAAVQASGLAHAWAAWAGVRIAHPAGQLALCALLLGVLNYTLFLPLHLYGSYFLEHRFGLSRLTPAGWVRREIKHVLVGGILSLGLLEGLFWLLRDFPERWPVYAAIGWIGISVILARVFPTLLLPIFYKVIPLEDAALAGRLKDLCARTGVAVLGIFRLDLGAETRKANAMLAGLGKTRRVLLSDTLLQGFTPDEIESVLAHELGHQRLRHIPKGLALASVGTFAIFWLTGMLADAWVQALNLRSLADPAGLPGLALWFGILNFIGQPVQNGISRAFEWEADHFAAAHGPSRPALASALRRLGDLNLADPAPPRWIEWLFYDHPAIQSRIRAAESGDVVL